ncbi:protein translocase subunit SecDF [Metamycoplasma buccale]|uniref:protein translocase subunit SecDF n=1 Tax=Metamycoplasma buccale TaxID=55602 RepID=UPI00398F3A08
MKKTRAINTKLRWIFNIFFVVAMLLAIIFGSIFYLKPKMAVNNSSKIDGVKATLKIKETTNKNLKNSKLPSPQEVLNTTKKYLQNSNLLSAYDLSLGSNNVISLASYAHKTDQEKIALMRSLLNKPYLTMTDENGNPVFYRGQFMSRLGKGERRRRTLQEFLDGDPADFLPSLAENPASARNSQGLSNRVSLKFTDDGWSEFIKYAEESYILGLYNKYFSALASNTYIWMNLKEFVEKAKREDPEGWKAAKENPVNYAYIGNSANQQEIDDNGKTKDGKQKKKKVNPVLKDIASKYLITVAKPYALRTSNVKDSSIWLVNENKNGYTDSELASAINYSMAPFELVEQSSYFITTNSSATNRYLVVLGIIYSLFAIFLIARYRLFGLLSMTTIAFFVFMLLVIIAAFNIHISPIIAIAIIIALIIVFDLIHNQLDIFRKEVMNGSNASKAISKSIKTTLISSLDSVVGIIILSLLSIFISVSYSTIIGMTMFTSIVLCFLIAIILQTVVLRNWAKTEAFDNTTTLILWKNSRSYNTIQKVNLISKSKYFAIGFAAFILIALIVYFGISGGKGSLLFGMNLNSELRGGFYYALKPKDGVFWPEDNINEIIKAFKTAMPSLDIQAALSNNEKSSYIALINSNTDILAKINSIIASNPILKGTQIESSQISPISLGIDTGYLIAIVFSGIVLVAVYMSFRYSLASALSLILNEIFVIIMMFAFILMTYTPFNATVVDAIILTSIFLVHDNILNAARIKDEFSKDLNTKNFIYTNDRIKEIFKTTIIDSISRQFSLLITWIVVIILGLNLMTSLNKTIVLGTTFGLISLVFINMFLIPNISMRMYMLKYKNKAKRIESGFWNTQKIREQSFIGINDFSE